MVKTIPMPPSRRPNVVERISMLQMAQTLHTGRVPEGGVRMAVVAFSETIHPDLGRDATKILTTTASEPQLNVKQRKRSRFLAWKRSSSDTARTPQVITVRLLDENEW